MAIIAVDFDSTLVESEDGYYYPVDGAREALQRMKDDGHKIIIYTCRTGIAAADGRLQEEIEFIKHCLAQFELEYDDIFLGEKLIANIYVDDRAVAFEGDWQDTLDQVKSKAKRWRSAS
jgi:phosphoglycolate phosphatase-like HAD superfamily hydrolase